MIPPELQPRPFRPYISSSVSAPSFSSDPNPNSFDAGPSFRRSFNTNTTTTTTTTTSNRFSSFAHNSRIAVALLPCAAFLLDLGGTPVVATLTVGLMISYILDSLSFKSGAFVGVWLSLLFSQIAFFFSSFSSLSSFHSLPLSFLAAFLCAQTTFLLGVWSSLQFKWIQIENPKSIVLALERLLFASLPFPASALFTWAAISAVGFSAASSYYLMAFNCLFYWLYSIPRLSSFKTNHTQAKFHGGQAPDDSFILGPLESCFHTFNLIFLPLLFHIASHHSVIFSSTASVADIFLLLFIPFLFQLYASTRGALWWITKNEHQLHSIRVANGAVALVVVVICLEIRVIFHSFGRYIQVPPPLNYLLVTTTMLGGAAAAGSYALGMVSDAFSSLAFTGLGVVVSAAGAIVVGFPLLVCHLCFLIIQCFELYKHNCVPSMTT